MPDPVETLPTELCIEILYLSSDHSADFHDTNTAPWTTSQVSRRWRSICISTPHLWSQIRVVFHDVKALRKVLDSVGRGAGRAWLKFIFQQRLEYAGDAPLYIFICTFSPILNWISLNALLPHTKQWKSFSLQLSLPDTFWKELLLILQDAPLPILEEVALGPMPVGGIVSTDYSSQTLNLVSVLARPPAITSLDISHGFATTLCSMDQDCLPWRQLRTLRVRSMFGSEAFYYCGPVLGRLSNIRVLSLCVKEPFTTDPSIDLARLSMPFLEELETTIPFSPHCVLSLVTAPKLRTLKISPYTPDSSSSGALTANWTYLQSFSSRSRCQIQSFSAGGGQFDPAVLVNMPFLRSLSLYELSRRRTTTLLSQLQGHDGSPACCPLLRQLLVTEARLTDPEAGYCFYTEQNLDLLARFLETRWRAALASSSAMNQDSSFTKRLEYFALIAVKPPRDDYLKIGEESRRRIGVLEADGMAIHVSFQGDFDITDPLEVLHGRQLPPRHRVYPLGPLTSQT